MDSTTTFTPKFSKFKANEIYNEKFVSIYMGVIHTTSLLTVILCFILIYVIIRKTPKIMSHLKCYLLLYSASTIAIQFVFLIYTPILLHPFVYIYPVGIANALPRNWSLIIIGTGAAASATFFNCCIALSFERFYALRYIKYVRKEPSKIPYRIFVILNFGVLITFVSGIILINIGSLNSLLIVPITESSDLIESKIENFISPTINIQTLLIFRGTEERNFSFFYIFMGSLFSLPVFLALGITILNVRKFYKLKRQLPPDVFKSNRMLLKLAYLHLLGIFVILGCPMICVGFIYWFIESPFYYVNLNLLFMNFFGIYDTLITVLCISPYRNYFFKYFKKNNVVNVVTVMSIM